MLKDTLPKNKISKSFEGKTKKNRDIQKGALAIDEAVYHQA